MTKPPHAELTLQRTQRTATYAQTGILPPRVDLTLSEALVLGLLRQGVKTYFTVFGHGSTEVGEVLRVYQQAGLVRVFGVRSEIEASHAASALRWITGEKAAVVTSIGPGALQAMSASLVASSDGIGVWYLLGDETTEDEGFNMQQIPKHEQGLFLQLAATIGRAYSLHTPLALSAALQRGAATVDHPYRPGPFFLLLPINTQATWLADFNLDELPQVQPVSLGAADGDYARVVEEIKRSEQGDHQSRGWRTAGRFGIECLAGTVGWGPGAYTDRHRLCPIQPSPEYGCGWFKRIPMWKLRHGARRFADCSGNSGSLPVGLLAHWLPKCETGHQHQC